MSLDAEWDAAVPIAKDAKGDLASQWKNATPVDVKPKAASKPKPKAEDKGVDWGNFPPLGVAEETAHMGTGMLAKPVSDAAGLAAIPMHAMGLTKNEPADVQRRVREGMTYEPRTATGRTAAQYNPLALLSRLWSAGAHGVGRMAGEDDPNSSARSAFGHGVEEAVNQLPQLAGAKVGAMGDALKGSARTGMFGMQSALKPSAKALETGKAARAIDTMLDKGVNVSPGGVQKLRAMVDDKNSAIAKLIDNSPDVIDKKAVAGYLNDSIKKFEKQVNPLDDLAAIQKAWDEFLAVHPDKIPIKQAQELKQGTYRALGDKSYGEVKGASIEAQKTLARGLKEEIAKAVPQVRKLNAEESELLNALSLTEKRVLMEANKNPGGLAWLTTDPRKFAAFLADRSGLFKSLTARMLNTAGDVAPKVPPLGMAVSSQASQPQQPRLPPPPQQ